MSDINLELYRVFYTVAKNKSITQTAEELNVSQPAISHSIKQLEKKLNGRLFLRQSISSKNRPSCCSKSTYFFRIFPSSLAKESITSAKEAAVPSAKFSITAKRREHLSLISFCGSLTF